MRLRKRRLGLTVCLALPAILGAAPASSEPGAVLEIRSVDGSSDVRSSRHVALQVPVGEPPSPFLAAAPFSATWTGFIQVDLRDRFRFAFEGTGKFQLYIGGRVRLEADSHDPESLIGRRVALNKGPNPFVATYQSPDAGDAECRLLWESTDFPMEPLPAAVVLHSSTDDRWVASTRLQRGRELLAEFRCLKCHLPGEAGLGATEGERHSRESGNPAHPAMLEMSEDAPSMETIAARTRPEWIPDWLEDPRRFHPDSPMPRMVHGPTSEQDAHDIAAWFESVGGDPLPSIEGDRDTGRRLFDDLGCIGCHTLSAVGKEVDVHHRTPLDRLPLKWRSSGELGRFLRNPRSHFESIRMPDFKLTEEEAGSLAAFLWDRDAQGLQPVEGDPLRGRDLLTALGCTNCHGGDLPPNRSFPPLETILEHPDWGCLDPAASVDRTAPLFPLTGEDLEAIRDFLASGRIDSLRVSDPVEASERYFAKLRCNACHERDGQQDIWKLLEPPVEDEAFEDFEADLTEPEIDQSRPSLTHIGEKLCPDWLEKRLRGETGESLRPWLSSRMPAFPFHATTLAEGFARAQGFPSLAEPIPASDSDLASIGERLVSRKEGFACNSCHPIGGRDPHAAYESVGTDFQFAAERLRPAYALRWMFNPQRLESKTKMPRYTNEEGKTPLVTLLDGDAPRQFEAIWHYLLRGSDISPPRADQASPTENR